MKNRKGAERWVTLQRDNMREFFDDNGTVLHLYWGSSYMNLYMRYNCTKLHTHKQMPVEMVKTQ